MIGSPSCRVALVALVLVLVAGACTHETAEQRAHQKLTDDQLVQQAKFSQLPAFKGVPWADDLKAEQDDLFTKALPTKPIFGDFTSPTFKGRFTNVTNGERWTLQLPCDRCPRRDVWLFGTSAAFGLGQRDDFTMASQLVRAAVAHGVGLQVHDFAVPGRTQVQEYEGLLAHLKARHHRPDLVLFYDGFNDVVASFMYAGVHPTEVLDPIRFDDTFVSAYLDKDQTPTVPAAEIRRVAAHVAASYAANQDRIRAALAPEHIPVAFVWQPDGFVSSTQLEGLKTSLNGATTKVTNTNQLGLLLSQVTARLGRRIHDLRVPMSTYPDPVFADTTHYNETGAGFAARVVWGWIEAALR